MRAFVLDRYRKKRVLRWAGMRNPELRDDEVLVQVHAPGGQQARLVTHQHPVRRTGGVEDARAGAAHAYVDADLTRGFDVPKSSPEDIVKRALDGLESGLDEVLADELTLQVKRGNTAVRLSYRRRSEVEFGP